MANQKTIDWFLKKYDSGEVITPEMIDILVKKGLRFNEVGRRENKYSPVALFALRQLCPVKVIAGYIYKTERAVRAAIAKAKTDGWFELGIADSNDESASSEQGALSQRLSRQVLVSNSRESYAFAFYLDASNRLAIEYERFL